MLNKRGQGLSTNAIILIILGVIILVILALGFTIGWKKLNPFLPSDNVEAIKTSCTAACATGNTYAFCTQERELKADGLEDAEGNTVKKVDGTCYEFATGEDYVDYDIEECDSITCITEQPSD